MHRSEQALQHDSMSDRVCQEPPPSPSFTPSTNTVISLSKLIYFVIILLLLVRSKLQATHISRLTNNFNCLSVQKPTHLQHHTVDRRQSACCLLGYLCRNICRFPASCEHRAYLALVCPLMEYGASTMDPYLKPDMEKLERIQRNTVSFISGDYFAPTHGSVGNLLISTYLPPLHSSAILRAVTLTLVTVSILMFYAQSTGTVISEGVESRLDPFFLLLLLFCVWTKQLRD